MFYNGRKRKSYLRCAQVLNICNLFNEILFRKERAMFSRRKAAYSAILPSLLLASRTIRSETQIINLFIAREGHEGFIEQGGIIALGPDILVSKIRNYLANTDPEPDMSGRGEEYGMVRLRPTEERDLIVEGYALVKTMLDEGSGKRRTIALAYIAILICHEMAHALGLRFTRNGSLRDNGKAFEPSPGLIARRLGSPGRVTPLVAVFYQFGPHEYHRPVYTIIPVALFDKLQLE